MNQDPENQTPEQIQDNETTETQTPEAPKPHDLRKQLEAEKKEKARLKAEIEALKKAEEDKNKSLEEKLAEEANAKKELERKLAEQQAMYNIKDALVKAKINPEFQDLLLEKAKTEIDSDPELLVEDFKTRFPSAFLKEEAKPLGKVGASITTGGDNVAFTKDQVIKALMDPSTPITPELQKAASQYGL